MKSLFTLLILSAFTLSTSLAQKDPAARAILDAMSNKYQNIPAYRAQFSYSMEDEDEDIDEGFKGTILVMSDKYKLLMDEQEILFDGTDIYTLLVDEKEMTISSFDPEEEEISLSNIFDIYKTGFKYLYKESRKNGTIDVIDLVPEDREKDYFKIRMEITSAGKELKNFVVFDKTGSRYVYKIIAFKEDKTITADTFVFKSTNYPGVEIIDFR